ncbi:MAG: EamA family transporter [Propioniciclava sp.]
MTPERPQRPPGGVVGLAVSPVLLVTVSIASVQVGSSVAKGLYEQVTPFTVAWLRLLSAAVVLAFVARPRLRGRRPREWAWVIAYGLVLAGMNTSFYAAIARIPIGMAVTLEFLGPLGVSVALSRRPRDLTWVALAAVGVVLLGFTPGDLDPVGIALALVAAAMWAAYILLAGPVGRSWAGVSGVTVGMWVGLAAATVPVLLAGALPPPAAPVWIQGLVVGLLASVIPYGLEMVALRRIQPRIFGILMSLEPAAAGLFAFLLLGEQLRPVEILAMACVITASIGVVRTARRAGSR